MDFITITTKNHLDKTLTLFDSILAYDSTSTLHILCVNGVVPACLTANRPNLRTYTIDSLLLADSDVAFRVRLALAKYGDIKAGGNYDLLRWSIKPLFAQYMRKLRGFKTLVYIDNDVYFHADYKFIGRLLDDCNVLLSPHWRPIKPTSDGSWKYNFIHGQYNAGFVGFGESCDKFLDWWSEMCMIACEQNPAEGLWVDQKYLDVVPLYFKNTKILEHLGCNVAAWNSEYLTRTNHKDKVLINNTFEVVFIHYSPVTIGAIDHGADSALYEFYRKYTLNLLKIRKELAVAGRNDCASS